MPEEGSSDDGRGADYNHCTQQAHKPAARRRARFIGEQGRAERSLGADTKRETADDLLTISSAAKMHLLIAGCSRANTLIAQLISGLAALNCRRCLVGSCCLQ